MICTLSTIIVPWSRIPWPPSPLPGRARPHRHPTVLGLPPPSLPHYCPAVLGPVATQPRHPLLLHAARPLSPPPSRPQKWLVGRRLALPPPGVCHPAPTRPSTPPPLRRSRVGQRGHRRGNWPPLRPPISIAASPKHAASSTTPPAWPERTPLRQLTFIAGPIFSLLTSWSIMVLMHIKFFTMIWNLRHMLLLDDYCVTSHP
jgi:hypothetical protein